MSDILVELTEMRRHDAALREAEIPFAEMVQRAAAAPAPRDFAAAFGGTGAHLIAELKRASPSEGMIREDFRPLELATELAAAGAAALSVLCEPHRFLGSEDYLAAVRKTVEIPLLYKDFLSTRYQIAAARAAGADAARCAISANGISASRSAASWRRISVSSSSMSLISSPPTWR